MKANEVIRSRHIDTIFHTDAIGKKMAQLMTELDRVTNTALRAEIETCLMKWQSFLKEEIALQMLRYADDRAGWCAEREVMAAEFVGDEGA